MTRAKQLAEEAFPEHLYGNDRESLVFGFEKGYERAMKDIGIVNELIDRKGIAVVESFNNYYGHQTIDLLRFVGEDYDKPRPLPCKYYVVWLKEAREEDLL